MANKVVRVAWVGCHEEGILAFESALAAKKNVVGFITLQESSFEKRSAGSRKYREYCQQYNVPYFEVETIKNDESYDIILSLKPDLLVVLGWSEILPDRLLQIPTIGTIGTHAALLPHNRGSAPINWALIHGETVTGNTMMWLSKDVDAGDIIDQMEIPITLHDTCKTLYDQVAVTNSVMLMKLIDNLEKDIRPSIDIENETDEELLPRRRPKDGLINWNQSGKAIYDFIRALTKPYPGAFTYLNGQKLLIWKAIWLPVKIDTNPGEIYSNAYGFSEIDSGLIVGTTDGAVIITEISDENGNEYRGSNLINLNLQGVFENE